MFAARLSVVAVLLMGCSSSPAATVPPTVQEAASSTVDASSTAESSTTIASSTGVGGAGGSLMATSSGVGGAGSGGSPAMASSSGVVTSSGVGGGDPCHGACDAHWQACNEFGNCAATNSCQPINPPFGDPEWQSHCPVLPMGSQTIVTLMCTPGDAPKGCDASANTISTSHGPMAEWCCVEGVP